MFVLSGRWCHGCKATEYIPFLLSKQAEDTANTSLTELAEKQGLLHLLKTMCGLKREFMVLLFISARPLFFSVKEGRIYYEAHLNTFSGSGMPA